MISNSERIANKLAIYKRLFETEDGQFVLDDIKANCFINKTTYAGGDPNITFINEGKRLEALRIMRLIELAEKGINQIKLEQDI